MTPRLPFETHVREALDHLAEMQVREVLSDGKWHRRAQISLITGLSDRGIRWVAEHSRGQIISGQLGYRLTRYASVEEIDHAERWLQSQARKMTHRAVEIRKARNGAMA